MYLHSKADTNIGKVKKLNKVIFNNSFCEILNINLLANRGYA